VSWAVTAKPKYAVVLIVTLNVAKGVQVTPLGEHEALKMLPVRREPDPIRRVHHRARAQRRLSPGAPRASATRPCHVGVTATNTFGALALAVSRIITPAFAQPLVLPIDATFASTMPSPVRVCQTKWNPSTVLQMSAPEPLIVIVLPEAVWEPANPTTPDVGGRPVAAGVTVAWSRP